MIYLWLSGLNPLIPTFIVSPLIAIVIGLLLARFGGKIYAGLGIALLLPLLFIASDLTTLKANLDAWALYGIVYAVLTYVVYKLTVSLSVR
ncbi:hypothetical protein J22TS3_45920 [Paenibacillus sp. J22TS3]|nr:hypothetical protein J22TS3_45920 [Paenibacillus sp. J22TS3]